MTIRNEDGWLIDDAGNRSSIVYWGTEERAREALESLVDCRDCTNCSDCSDCSGCSRCSDCSDCSDCSRCSGCSGCSRCSDCSDCSGCSRCSDCSDCQNVAFLYDKKNLKGDPSADPNAVLGQPPIPVIEHIHQKVFEAVSRPGALEMGSWHTCNTTHCRGGWVVHLAGEAGYALARYHNDLLAAQLIYRASGYEINPGRFFDSNEVAMANMKRLAETQPTEPAA